MVIQLMNKLQNYLLISIDPYSPDAINKGEKIVDKIKTPREMKISVHPSKPWSSPKNTKKIISKIYHYFINNKNLNNHNPSKKNLFPS